MDFAFEHPLQAPRELVAEALLDTDFQTSLDGLGPLSERTLLSQERLGDGVVRRTRCVLGIDLPGAARRFIGRGEPSWVEEATWDPGKMTWTWTVHPDAGGGLLNANGHIELIADGDATRRRVSGTVQVAVPLYGGRVESRVVRGLKEAYAEEASRLTAWLGSHPRGVTPS
jgi:hypothetical protein